ncbi:hypothetical protein GCM10010174_80710 [Kutzneria viridogrisea]|uniref:Uncharacterized protein n=1 Tax=Kutzneria viridogrisea TaxID=47990 RepID=A0ABR6BZK3_9PSEU|nr:hypothetical protein [Kutzneria viridogrisea]
MSFLDRFRRDRRPHQYAAPRMGYTAIPLTPDEVALYVEAQQEAHRSVRRARPDIGGASSWSTMQANEMLRRAGIAAAQGGGSPLDRRPARHIPGAGLLLPH